MSKAKGKTVTYNVTLTERDAVSFLELLDNASEEGKLAAPFDVQLVPKSTVRLIGKMSRALIEAHEAYYCSDKPFVGDRMRDIVDEALRDMGHESEYLL